MVESDFIAPDGGWGWVVVIAFALNNIVAIPIMQGFGIVYGGTFKRLEITATQMSLILNINQSFGMIFSFFHGPLLRRYGYRKVAVCGCLTYSVGVILTSFASTFVQFVLFYGIITSGGLYTSNAAFSLALNTFFKKKRGRATGFTMTLTGLGPIFMPHVLSTLMTMYDSEGTMLILGAISLHPLIGALLLEPISMHAKRAAVAQGQLENSKDNEDGKNVVFEMSIDDQEGKLLDNKKLFDVQGILTSDSTDNNVSVYGYEMPVSIQNGSLMDMREILGDSKTSITKDETFFDRKSSSSKTKYIRSNSLTHSICFIEKPRKLSVNSKCGDLIIDREIIDKFLGEKECHNDYKEGNTINESGVFITKDSFASPQKDEKNKLVTNSMLQQMIQLFDLDLLRDPIFVNITVGVAIVICSELNYSVLFPFILSEMSVNPKDIAMTMSTLATSDILFRGLAPFIGEWLRKPARTMHMYSLVMLIISRTALLFAENYSSILIAALGLGIARGFRTVYIILVIPGYVPLEKLATASSILSIFNGFFMIIFGSGLGWLRDVSSSYAPCVVMINMFTAMTLIMWLIEFGVKRLMNRQRTEIDEAVHHK